MRTVDDFIALFSAIPAETWCIGTTTLIVKDEEGKPTGEIRHCALGFAGDTLAERKDLYDLFDQIGAKTPSFVNDGRDSRFQQTEPRGRILAALQLIKGAP